MYEGVDGAEFGIKMVRCMRLVFMCLLKRKK